MKRLDARDLTARAFLAVVAAVCIYQRLEFAGSIAIVGFILVVYKNSTLRFVRIADSFLARATYARLRDLEVRIDEAEGGRVGYPRLTDTVLEGLRPGDVALLISVGEADNFDFAPAIIDDLRRLRARGLITHNRDSLASSDAVTLTALGSKVVKSILSEVRIDTDHRAGDVSE